MEKVHYQTDQEELFRACDGHMTTLFDEGNIKSAASDTFTADLLKEHMPDKDHYMLHLVAMGDMETYSANKNGDGFPKAALEKYHPTFVSDGCYFREHRNRCKETQGIGTIKASAFNKKMRRVELIVHGNKKKSEKEYEMAKAGKALSFSMSCFPAGTSVMLENSEEKNIEDIKVGDKVLTHKGNVCAVSHIMNRHFTGTATKIRAYGLPEPIICTQDHGIWTRPKMSKDAPCPVCGKKFKVLKAHLRSKKDAQHVNALNNYSKYTEGFMGAGLLNIGDYVRTAFNTPKEEAPAVESFKPRLLGFYLAEGSLSVIDKKYKVQDGTVKHYKDYRTEFCFNINETSFVEEVKDLVCQFTGKRPSSFDYSSEHRTIIRVHSKELHDWLLLHGGKYSDKKVMSPSVMAWNRNDLKSVMEAWIDGDGTWHKTNEVLCATTVSRRMVWQFLEIAARNGICARLTSFLSKVANRKRSYIIYFNLDGDKLNVSKIPSSWAPSEGKIRSYGHLKHQTEGALTKHLVKCSNPQFYIENGFIYRKIRTIENLFLDEPVYDLTVPGDHGFQVHGYGVSNCRVPYDECSCCGNKATSPKNYCEHLKSAMLQYIPEFKKYAFAINDHPKFFDISVVEKPADRIAHYLSYAFPDGEKRASFNGVITGSDWAAYEGVTLPNLSKAENWAPAQIDLLEKLASAEDYLENTLTTKHAHLTDNKAAFAKNVAINAFDSGDDLSDSEIDKLRSLEVGTMCRELSKRAAILPFNTFVAYSTNTKISDVKEDPVVKRACCMLPEIFRKLMSSDCNTDLGGLFSSSSDYSCAQDSANNDQVQQLMDLAEKKFSIKAEPVRNRVITITIKSAGINKSASKSSLVLGNTAESKAKNLAEAYGLYKLSALMDMKDIFKLDIDEPQYLLAIGQNIL